MWVTQVSPHAPPKGLEEASGVWSGGGHKRDSGGSGVQGSPPNMTELPPQACPTAMGKLRHGQRDHSWSHRGAVGRNRGGLGGVPRRGWFWGGGHGGFPRRGILRGFVGSQLCPWGLGGSFYVSFSGVPRWEGMSEGVPSKFKGHLCGVFWGALRCWGAAVLGY